MPKRIGSRSIVESRPPSVCSCTILMISSYVYTALNTKSADLVESHHGEEPTKNSCSSAWGKLQRATSDAYQRNLGLLLIIGSQMFLSLVNVAVKKLNDIDPPVSALEVRKLMRFLRIQELDSCDPLQKVDCCTDGALVAPFLHFLSPSLFVGYHLDMFGCLHVCFTLFTIPRRQ